MCIGFAGEHAFDYEDIARIAKRLTEKEVMAALALMQRQGYSEQVVTKAERVIKASKQTVAA